MNNNVNIQMDACQSANESKSRPTGGIVCF